MSDYASTTAGRNEAAAEIERMARDISEAQGAVVTIRHYTYANKWEIVTAGLIEHTAPTLNEAYLAALAWPDDPYFHWCERMAAAGWRPDLTPADDDMPAWYSTTKTDAKGKPRMLSAEAAEAHWREGTTPPPF
jgi:hypothetical protein